MPFLEGHQRVELQLVNKFCYDIAVSRVEVRILIPKNFYFTYRTTRYKHVLFSIDGTTNKFSKIKNERLDFENESSVQVK